MLYPQTVDSPAAWRAETLEADWRLALDADERAELRRAVDAARSDPRPLFELTRAEFGLPRLGPRLEALRQVLEGGRGFQLLSGLPISATDLEHNKFLLWAVGRHLGEPEPQDKAGALLHVVADTGRSVERTTDVRAYQTNAEIQFHTDGADVFALLCVRQAPTGGESRIVSSTAIFNTLVTDCPEIAETLQEPFAFDARAQNPWEKTVQSVPIFTYHEGYVSALYKRLYIELAQRFDEVAPLRKRQREALDRLDATAADPKLALRFRMAAGDLLLANNYSCFHARTAYEDASDGVLGRMMLRLWLTLPNGRPLPAQYAETREWGLTYRRRAAALT